MLIGVVFLLAAVAPRDEGSRYRRDLAAAGEDLIQDDGAYPDPGPEAWAFATCPRSSCATSWASTAMSCSSFAFRSRPAVT